MISIRGQSVSPRLDRSLEMTRRISKQEEIAINSEISKLTNLEGNIQRLLHDFENNHWGNILADPDMPYYALLAFQANLLSTDDFALLQIAWAGQKTYEGPLTLVTPKDFQFKKLLTENLTLPASVNAEELKKRSRNYVETLSQYSSQLTAEQLEVFFAEVNKLPPSQQLFFTAKETIDLLKMRRSKDVMDKLSTANFSILGRPPSLFQESDRVLGLAALAAQHGMSPEQIGVPLKKQVNTIIASPGIKRAYRIAKFGAQAVEANYVLGLSDENDIRNNAMLGTRDVALRFLKVAFPDTADDLEAKWLKFTNHDDYHVFASSAAQLKELFAGLYDTTKDFLQQKSNSYNAALDDEDRRIKSFASALIDMEHGLFRSLFSLLDFNIELESPAALFLLTLTIKLKSELMLATNSALSAETTQALLNNLCHYLIGKDSEIDVLMTEGYLDVIARQYNEKANYEDKVVAEQLNKTAEIFNSAWRGVCKSSPMLFDTNIDPAPARGMTNTEVTMAPRISPYQ